MYARELFPTFVRRAFRPELYSPSISARPDYTPAIGPPSPPIHSTIKARFPAPLKAFFFPR